MNTLQHRFTLDMQSNVAQISLQMRKLDNYRELLINLTDGGKPYLITPGSVAVFVCKNADGESFERNCTIQNSIISCLIDREITFLPGVTDGEIRLYGPYGEDLASPRFLIVVNDRVAHDDDYSIPEEELDLLDSIFADEAERKAAEISRESAEEARQQRFNTAMETYGEKIAQTITSAQIADGLAQSALNSANEAVTRANAAASVAEQASNTANEASEKANEAASNVVSPTVSVTSITGGHRVAVTDKNGTKTFDVMDGKSYTYGSTDLVAGSSALATGMLHLVYE